MEMKQLESFVTACERGSISQAAACMYTTQPNVSKTIRTLEHELGRPLLVRSAKGVQPTVYGKTVLEYAKLILRATATISSLAVPDEQDGLRLSTYPSNMVSRLLVDFYKTWGPRIHIEHRGGDHQPCPPGDLRSRDRICGAKADSYIPTHSFPQEIGICSSE